MELSARQLATAMPTLRAPRVWLAVLNEAVQRFEIDSSARIAAFLELIARESNECRYLEEDLRFPAAMLMRLWPKRFPTAAMAGPYERNPEKLANLVYANRWGNGPPESCDGYRFRGRGLIRIIGRAQYASVGAALGLDLESQPESLLAPRNAAMSAAWFWKTRGGEGANRLPFAGALQIQPQAMPMPLFGAPIGVTFPAGE
jgi:putative chitinase